MSWLEAIILGFVQGLTEFLPVSSSGHLGLIKGLFGMDVGESILFDVLLHFATLVSITAVFFKELKDKIHTNLQNCKQRIRMTDHYCYLGCT